MIPSKETDYSQELSTDKPNSLDRYFKSLFFVLLIVFAIAIADTLVTMLTEKWPELHAGFLAKAFGSFAVAISVSLIFYWAQDKLQASNMSRASDRYSKVLAFVDMMQSARENNGLAGIKEDFSEKEKFEELATRTSRSGKPPIVYWMNFRIESANYYADYIAEFVRHGGVVKLITTHHENPNIEFRHEDAYPEIDIEDYKQQFVSQSRRFIKLEEDLEDAAGEFRVFFNKGMPCVPLFITTQDKDVRAYSGFYLKEKSGDMPYIAWETAGRGMVVRFSEYFELKLETCTSAIEMKSHPDISRSDQENSDEHNGSE